MTQKQIGKFIRKKRKSLGIRQQALAARIGLHQTAICRIELGTQDLSLKQAQRIAKCLGFEMNEYFPSPARGNDHGIEGASP